MCLLCYFNLAKIRLPIVNVNYIACSLPPKLCLEVLGLPKLILSVVVLGRLPIGAFSAPQNVFRGVGLA